MEQHVYSYPPANGSLKNLPSDIRHLLALAEEAGYKTTLVRAVESQVLKMKLTRSDHFRHYAIYWGEKTRRCHRGGPNHAYTIATTPAQVISELEEEINAQRASKT